MDLILCSAWKTFQSDSERIAIPFVLEWDSGSSDTDFCKRWQDQCEHWIFTNDRTAWKRIVYTAIVAADEKLCLVVYIKKIDEDDGQVKQKMTMFLPKSCEGIEFPVQDLTGFFSMFAGVEEDI